MVALPDDRLEGLAIDEPLRDAIREYKRTRSHEGKRRQMQYIGKLMRRADPEPLREAVAAMALGRAKDALALHESERWRSELVASDDALTRWTAAHPDSDLQQLRSLIRAARKDAAAVPEQRSGRAYRELFKFIRDQLRSGSHRCRFGQRPGVERCLRRQGHPGAERLARAGAAQSRDVGNAADPRRAGGDQRRAARAR